MLRAELAQAPLRRLRNATKSAASSLRRRIAARANGTDSATSHWARNRPRCVGKVLQSSRRKRPRFVRELLRVQLALAPLRHTLFRHQRRRIPLRCRRKRSRCVGELLRIELAFTLLRHTLFRHEERCIRTPSHPIALPLQTLTLCWRVVELPLCAAPPLTLPTLSPTSQRAAHPTGSLSQTLALCWQGRTELLP